MKPYYDESGITIYHGDCRDVLPQLRCVDAVITDPPYGIGFKKYLSHEDNESFYPYFLSQWVPLAEALVTNGWCCVFQAENHAHHWREWFPMDWRLMALPKTFGQIGREQISRHTDYALYWTVGNPDWPPISKAAPRFFRDWYLSREVAATINRPNHPCPRPLDTMKYLVQMFCPPRGIILDSFSGSGSTLVAAKDLSRKAIGIEIEERYCEVAARRLAQGVFSFNAMA